jgi:hypothetical protein
LSRTAPTTRGRDSWLVISTSSATRNRWGKISHLSFLVKQRSTSMRAVGWGMAERRDELLSSNRKCCVAFTPKINEWNGNRTIEMEVSDFQAGGVARLG